MTFYNGDKPGFIPGMLEPPYYCRFSIPENLAPASPALLKHAASVSLNRKDSN